MRGNATLDGAPFDAEFLGAAVRDHGLITPCQATLPQVEQGRYEIEVLSIAAASGCGAPDSEVLFWTFTNDTQYFSTAALPWPADGQPTNFDIGFATATPKGTAPRMTEFAGEVFEQDGRQLPDGTRVEARIGNALCGVASVRTSGDFTGFSLSVVGPESIAGCDAGRDGDLPRRWTSGDHDGGQRLSLRPVARPDTSRGRRVVPCSTKSFSQCRSGNLWNWTTSPTLVPRILVAGAGTGPTLVSCRCT